MEQFAPGFRNLRLLPGLREGTQPLDCPISWHADLRGLLDLGQRRGQGREWLSGRGGRLGYELVAHMTHSDAP
jgi:hypothetical protein